MLLRVLLAVVAALALTWLALVVALLVARPKGSLLTEALRLLPAVLRPLRRLAGDRSLPRGVRIRPWLLLGYLAIPIDIVRRAGLEPICRPLAGIRGRARRRPTAV